MNRREFLALLAGAAAATPFTANAQPALKIYRVGLINSNGPDFWEPDFNLALVRAFHYGVRDLGYVEGHNLDLRRRSAEGKGVKRAAEIGAELIRDGIDLIVTDTGSMTKEMMRVTNTVPILMGSSVDP